MPAEHPWAFKDGNPQKRIAAPELLGTLLLCKHLIAQQGTALGRVRLPVGSDNSGNIFQLTEPLVQETTHRGPSDGTGSDSSP